MFVPGVSESGGSNLVDFYADTGAAVSGIKSRSDDKFGIAFAYSRISGVARSLDQDYTLCGMPRPLRDYEADVTVAHVAEIRGGTVCQHFNMSSIQAPDISSVAGSRKP